jgi:mono/diheme cytochrome c family protein
MVGVGGTVLLGVGAFFAFLYTGIYPIAANEPHSVMVSWVLSTLQANAVRLHSDDRPAPELADSELLADGLVLYHEHCAVCHGAPGVERAVMGRGLNPDPPRLATEIREWSDSELFWIVANGLKMAGMPAFQPGLDDRQVWATVAFMRALPQITPQEYRQAAGAATTTIAALMQERLSAPTPGPDFEADVQAGRRLVEAYGCGSCHEIPGVANSRGQVGPPLHKFGLRHYVAGAVLNTPESLTAWIVAPETIEPGTAMPSVGATPEDAAHMAAYLLSLGADRSVVGPKGIFPAAWLPKH